jgi:hypothetical protein
MVEKMKKHSFISPHDLPYDNCRRHSPSQQK